MLNFFKTKVALGEIKTPEQLAEIAAFRQMTRDQVQRYSRSESIRLSNIECEARYGKAAREAAEKLQQHVQRKIPADLHS